MSHVRGHSQIGNHENMPGEWVSGLMLSMNSLYRMDSKSAGHSTVAARSQHGHSTVTVPQPQHQSHSTGTGTGAARPQHGHGTAGDEPAGCSAHAGGTRSKWYR